MGVGSGWYDTVMVLHVLCVIVGFGGVMLNGLYGAESKKRPGRDGLAVFEATQRVGKVAEHFIYAVPVFGIALVLMSHAKWGFGQAWVSAAIAIYAVALSLVLLLHLPNLRRMGVLMGELVALTALPAVAGGAVPRGDDAPAASGANGPPPQVGELAARGRRAGVYGAVLNLAVVAVVVLMVWKPGAPAG